ncbi:MAG: hypothetical protein HC896_19125 [Bacteroidales bacterium]|nr:hypothetical protein [Bacteroidales bacterium]
METVSANRLKLSIDNVADYVFNEDYNLRTLTEVESFVKANKHLPGMPKGQELEKNGMDVAQMNNLLLEKIEELTLYVIEQNKRIEELEKQTK